MNRMTRLMAFAAVLAAQAMAQVKGVGEVSMDKTKTGQDGHWTENMRVVCLRLNKKMQGEALEQTLAELKEQGVNTIIDHGSMQFLPDLPDNMKSQWQSQVNYELAIPFSQAIRRAGFRLIHHTTSTFTRIEAMENPRYRPWVSENLNTGMPALRQPNTAYADACFMDMNHPGFRSFLFGRMAEYVRKTGADAFETDEVEWLPDIYACGTKEGSRAAFRRKYGEEMPSGTVDTRDVRWRRYIAFRFDSGGDFYGGLLESLQQANPDIQLSGCLAGISKNYRRIWAMGAENWLRNWTMGFYEMEEAGHPKGKRCGFMSVTEFPRYVREMSLYQAHAENYNWSCCYCVGYPSTWKCENSEQLYLWALSLSMGFRYEMRDYQMEGEWFKWEAEHERLFLRPKERNEIGIFFPEQSRDFNEPEVAERICRDWGGFGEALAWHAIPASQLVRGSFADSRFPGRLKLIVMPSNEYMSPEMLSRLKGFVEQGGILLVSGPCRLADPFTDTPMAQEELNAFLGIAEKGETVPGKIAFQIEEGKSLPAGSYLFNDGMSLIAPTRDATVLAGANENFPAVIERPRGKGRVILFAGCWGCSMTHSGAQKEPNYVRGYSPEQRRLFAETARRLLAGKMSVEVRNLPEKVLFNTHISASSSRILHFLDSFDGCEPGELIPENQPLRFKPFAERNGGGNVTVLLRGDGTPRDALLHSIDRAEPLALKPAYDEAEAAWRIEIPAGAFGRYSVLEAPMR